MVRKIIACFCMAGLVAFATSRTVSSAELDVSSGDAMTTKEIVMLASETAVMTVSDIYDEGNLNSTYVTYFRDLLPRVKPYEKYIGYRSGQYEYTFIYGDITLSGTTFNIENAISVTFYTSSGYNSTYTINFGSVNGESLDVGNNIVYSNLGNYPMLEERGEIYEYTQIIVVCIIGLAMFVRGIFHRSR